MKAILVIDMPKSCEDCPCTDYMFCYATQKELEIDWEVNKPSWCPLKPMPLEQDIYEEGIDEENTRAIQQWNKGWNACLKEIEK